MGGLKAAGHAVETAGPPGAGGNVCGAGKNTGRRLKRKRADAGRDAP